MMRIFVDADACPAVVKEILFRAAMRAQIPVMLFANQRITTPISPYISMQVVAAGFDVADDAIIQQARAGDLVITADIPLADAVITKGGLGLNPRGCLYTQENIKEHLTTRNLMTELRESGIVSGGPRALKQKDRQAFANQLDTLITRHHPKGSKGS